MGKGGEESSIFNDSKDEGRSLLPIARSRRLSISCQFEEGGGPEES